MRWLWGALLLVAGCDRIPRHWKTNYRYVAGLVARIENDFKRRDVGNRFRAIVDDPDFVNPGFENQRVDVVVDLTFVVGLHRQNRELRPVGPFQM